MRLFLSFEIFVVPLQIYNSNNLAESTWGEGVSAILMKDETCVVLSWQLLQSLFDNLIFQVVLIAGKLILWCDPFQSLSTGGEINVDVLHMFACGPEPPRVCRAAFYGCQSFRSDLANTLLVTCQLC